MYLLSRIILYPLCLGFGIWCAIQFKDAFEGSEIRKYRIDTDNPGELTENNRSRKSRRTVWTNPATPAKTKTPM